MSPIGRRQKVFIFGAGVSASFGIAVTKNLLKDTVRYISGPRLRDLHSLLEFMYPGFDETLKNYPNIEDFLNLLEMAKTFNTDFQPSARWDEGRLEGVERTVLRGVTQYLWEAMRDTSKLEPLELFAERLFKPGNVAITFNWDLTVERVWYDHSEDLDLEYTFPKVSGRKKFYLLKPHGSIDWFKTKPLRGTTLGRRMDKHDEELGYYPYFKISKDPDLLKHLPVIVPPVYHKEFKTGFLNKVWTSVYTAVSRATDLWIIGYSMPREDQFARFVFRRAIRNNIANAQNKEKPPLKVTVINPDESVEGIFSRLVGTTQATLTKKSAATVSTFEFIQAQFQDYVAGLSASS